MERYIFKQEGEKFKFIFLKDHPRVSVNIRPKREDRQGDHLGKNLS